MNTKNIPNYLNVLSLPKLGVRIYAFLAASLLFFAPTVPYAQETGTEDEEIVELEEFQVEGIREGIAKAMETQRDSLNLIDVIESNSVGNLPDSNVAEALQRLPGLYLVQQEGDGRFVSIRGVDPSLNNVTMNGQTMAVSDIDGRTGRAAPLDVMSSSALASIKVVKVPTPDMWGQGLGGTIDILSPSAFDRQGPFAFGSAKFGFNDLCGTCDIYEGDINFGTTFGKDDTWGLFVNLNTFKREYTFHQVEQRGHTYLEEYAYVADDGTIAEGAPYGPLFVAGDTRHMAADGVRNRTGINWNLEFRPSEDTQVWLRGFYTDYDEQELRPQTVIRSREYRAAVFTSPTTGYHMVARIEAETQLETTERPTYQAVLGGRHRFSDAWTLEANLNFTRAEENDPVTILLQEEAYWAEDPDNPGSFEKHDLEADNRGLPLDEWTRDNAVALFDNTDFFPVQAIPSGMAGWPFPGGVDDLEFHAFYRNRREITNVKEDTATFTVDLQWDGDLAGKSTTLKFGFNGLSRDKSVADKSNRYIPSGKGPITLDDNYNGIPYGVLLSQTRIGGYDFGPSSGPFAGYYTQLLGPFSNPSAFDAEYRDLIGTELDAVWDPITNTPDPATLIKVPGPWELDVEASRENAVEDAYTLTEDIYAAYLMGSMNITEDLNLMAGARMEWTDGNMDAFAWVDDRTDQDGGATIVPNGPIDKNYNNVLPAAILRWNASERVQVRASVSSSIGRPNYPDMAPIAKRFRIRGSSSPYTASLQEGNPGLEPYEALNLDASVAYFFGDGSGMIQAAFFHKQIDNPIYGLQYDAASPEAPELLGKEVERLPNGNVMFRGWELSRLDINTVNNADQGEITGIELTYNQAFTFLPDPFNGFGIAANVAFIDSSVEIPTRPGEDLPFFMQASNVFNAQLYYQRSGFGARIAWHYQDEALFSVGGNERGDAYNYERGYFDAQISYQFNRMWSVFVEGKNLTNEPMRTYVWKPEYLGFHPGFETYGTTYYLGATWSWGR